MVTEYGKPDRSSASYSRVCSPGRPSNAHSNNKRNIWKWQVSSACVCQIFGAHNFHSLQVLLSSQQYLAKVAKMTNGILTSHLTTSTLKGSLWFPCSLLPKQLFPESCITAVLVHMVPTHHHLSAKCLSTARSYRIPWLRCMGHENDFQMDMVKWNPLEMFAGGQANP